MKQAMIYKGFAPEELPAEELVKINRHTRRELSAEEVYVFPLILCDNEVDRDCERFAVDALYKLRKLFLGKTGIFDHNPQGQNQTARIYSTAVEKDEMRKTQAGEVYHFLTAKAYMVRSERNKDLILDIDAGIKKEVSVGCAVDEVLCSVCNQDVRQKPCKHIQGKSYDGAVCHHVLSQPKDAYEWSFVAVPAQPAAGVTKAYDAAREPERESGGTVRERLEKCVGEVVLSHQEAKVLDAELKSLSAFACHGREYLEELRRDVLRTAALHSEGINQKTIASMVEKLTAEELRELKKTFGAGKSAPPLVQLGGMGQARRDRETALKAEPDNSYFQI